MTYVYVCIYVCKYLHTYMYIPVHIQTLYVAIYIKIYLTGELKRAKIYCQDKQLAHSFVKFLFMCLFSDLFD